MFSSSSRLTTLNCEIPSSLDTLWVLLVGCVSMASNTFSESVVLGLLDLLWSLTYLQSDRNFLSHLAIVQESSMDSLFAQQMLLVASKLLWLSLNSKSLRFKIRLPLEMRSNGKKYQSYSPWGTEKLPLVKSALRNLERPETRTHGVGCRIRVTKSPRQVVNTFWLVYTNSKQFLFLVNRLFLYLSLPPTRQNLTQGQMTRRSDYSGGLGRRKEDPNPGSSPASLCWSPSELMSLAGHGLKHESWYRFQIIA